MQSAVITLSHLRQIGTRGLSTVSHPSAELGAMKGLRGVAVSQSVCFLDVFYLNCNVCQVPNLLFWDKLHEHAAGLWWAGQLHVNRLQMEEFPVVSPSGWKAKTDINITMKHHKGYCFIAFTTVWVMFLIFSYYFILASLLCSRLVGYLFFSSEEFETCRSPPQSSQKLPSAGCTVQEVHVSWW